jgi:hypothetical protein
MPETCTCGAQLPPDSLFCHKCGKPQREIIEPEVVVSGIPLPVTVIPPPVFTPPPRFAMPVSIRNPAALQIALFVGAGAMLLSSFLPLVNWLAAGFFAVFFYRRKTRHSINVGAGLHLGWITGLIMFTMWGIFFMALGLSGKLAPIFQEQLKNLPTNNDPYMQQMAQFMGSGAGLMVLLAVGFVFITSLSMAGGALGAKMVGRE